MKFLHTVIFIITLFVVFPLKSQNIAGPEGWARCSSVDRADDYELSGGGVGSLIVLRSDGKDMRQTITEAVNTYDIIVFDGKNGDFEVSSNISLQSLSGRTLIGVNGACLRTTYTVPQEVKDMLDEMNVNSLSSNPDDNLGGTLSNGMYVNEQCELTIRQALIDRYGDPKEPYRYAGVFTFYDCSNIIIRNLDFVGPGSLDVGGMDLLTLVSCDHVWVDHCRFTDGLDGNLDIINNSDFVTVSDTHFRYTDKSYNHPLSNLNSGTEITDGSPQKNNISWIRCFWDEGCRGRMPFTVYGIHHILNCYWDCTKGTCIDARLKARLLVENSFFTSKVSKPLALRDETVLYEWKGNVTQGRTSPKSNSAVSVPYKYTVHDVQTVPFMAKSAGATLSDPYQRELSSYPAKLDFGQVYAACEIEGRLNISAFGGDIPSSVTVSAPEGVMLALDPHGEYVTTLQLESKDENLFQSDIYVKAIFGKAGINGMSIEVTADGKSFYIPVTADVTGLEGERMNADLTWPLDKGLSNATIAQTDNPQVFSKASFTLGEKIYIHSSKKIGSSETFTLFNPTEAIGRAVDEDCCIVFDVETEPGYTFVPKKLRLNASRMGTDMCFIDIECSRGQGTPQKMVTAFQPARSSESPAYSEIELPLTGIGVGDKLYIKIYLYNMSVNKQLALNGVTIEGDAYSSESAIETIPAEKESGEVLYYDLQGRRVLHPQNGRIYIVRTKDNNAQAVIYVD